MPPSAPRCPTVDPVMAEQRAAAFATRSIKAGAKLRGLLLAMSMLDLTTLEGKDSPEKVRALCRKAARPAEDDERVLGLCAPAAAAVCVYPALVRVAREALAGTGVRVASVATGFPSGQYPLAARLRDCEAAIRAGADEIDMVINRGAFLSGRYAEVAREIREVAGMCVGAGAGRQTGRRHNGERIASRDGPQRNGARHPDRASPGLSTPGKPHLKVILETGELETYDNIRRASDLAIGAMDEAGLLDEPGAGFIKTSTGKVQPAATMPATLVMLEAIRDFHLATGKMVGMKPAGGLRAAKAALHYLVMVKETLGEAWLSPRLFRFGASSLANDLLRQIYRLRTGKYMAEFDFSEA